MKILVVIKLPDERLLSAERTDRSDALQGRVQVREYWTASCGVSFKVK